MVLRTVGIEPTISRLRDGRLSHLAKHAQFGRKTSILCLLFCRDVALFRSTIAA